MSRSNGFHAMITQHSWMFLGTYEEFRDKAMVNDIVNLIHLGAHAFEEISGEVVQTVSFFVRKSILDSYNAVYSRLVDIGNAREKETEFLKEQSVYVQRNDKFKLLPGQVLAYWACEGIIDSFSYPKMGELYAVKSGLSTGDNNIFVRYWFEIQKPNFSGLNGYQNSSMYKWVPYNKGGGVRKWYGINNLVVLWGGKW